METRRQIAEQLATIIINRARQVSTSQQPVRKYQSDNAANYLKKMFGNGMRF